MRQRRFCTNGGLNTDILFGSKNWNCSRSTRSFSLLRSLPWTTFYGEQVCIGERSWKICFRHVTRREGTSKSNILCAKGDFATKVDWTQICTCNRKIGIARDPTDRLEFPSDYFAQLFMENQAVLARGPGKFVFDKFWLVQGRHGGTIFHSNTIFLDFLANFR